MSWLDRLEKKGRRFGVRGVVLCLAIAQGMGLVASLVEGADLSRLNLVANDVKAGEVWRLVTFLALPPCGIPILAFLGIYFFFIMGTALEGYWGAFRLNLYLFVGYLATVSTALILPDQPTTNALIVTSVFLAFATVYPDFVIYLMFILPIRIRWLAMLTWIGYAFSFIVGDWMIRGLIALSVANYFMFFGGDVWRRIKYGHRKMAESAKKIAVQHVPFHTCAACGKTDASHPKLEFRYCSRCGGVGYCEEHIGNHEHRRP